MDMNLKAIEVIEELNKEVARELGEDDVNFMFLILMLILMRPNVKNLSKEEYYDKIYKIFDIIDRNENIKELFN